MKYQIIIALFIAFCCMEAIYASDTNITNQSNVNVNNTSLSAENYNIGHPVLTNIYVDPVKGYDDNLGSSSSPLYTLTAALDRVPLSKSLNKTGFRIMLMPGNYTERNLPDNGWVESRYGTYNYPIIIQSANNTRRANIKTMDIFNLYNCRYFYFIGLNFESNANNVLHLEKCDHILIKNVTIKGKGTINDYTAPQEDLKANQCQNIFIEDSEIYNAWNVPLDFVAVKTGHILNNRIHDAGDWVVYLKGGSSHFLISGNEIYNALNGGFSAGQGTGFEYMESPYIHYETYDIKFVNNIIHDTDGAGMGSSGSYNILLAYNTLYRVGKNSHALEFGHGIRSCNGNRSKCHTYITMGGWGSEIPGMEERIPNKNIYVYNNIIYNPTGYQSQWSQLSVANPVIPGSRSNIRLPSRADDNLIIKGNIIWNGPSNLPLGIEDVNTRLNPSQLKSQNYINTLKPQLIDPEHNNFRPIKGGNVFKVTTYPILSFPGNDAPIRPLINVGNINNSIYWDHDKNLRTSSNPPGAYAYSFLDVTNPTVKATPPGGLYNTTQVVKLNMSEPGTIYYTLNGTNPNTSSLKYTGPITITMSTILKYFARDAVGRNSMIYTQNYKIDRTPPTVTSTDPANNAINIARDKVIRVTFSEGVKGVNWGIELKNSSGSLIPNTKSITGNVLTITPNTRLSPNTKYTLYLHTGSVTDLAGNPLASVTKSFTTGNT